MRTTAAVTSCASWLRPPAVSTIAVLVGLPLTTNVPDETGADVGHGQADKVDVLVELVVELGRVGARRGGALRHDDDEDGERRRGELGVVAGRDARPAEVREAARHGADRADAVRRERQRGAGDGGRDDGEQRPGHPARKPGAERHGDQHGGGDGEGAEARVAEVPDPVPDLGRRTPAGAGVSRTCRPALRRPPGCRRR